MKVIIGVGGSGSLAATFVGEAIAKIRASKGIQILGESPIYENPASGGITLAPFANAAILIESDKNLETLWQELHQTERQQGRIRLLKNGPRTLDLDILWAEQKPTQKWLQVPHPRFLERDFALLPALAAFKNANLPPPALWEKMGRKYQALSRLKPIYK